MISRTLFILCIATTWSSVFSIKCYQCNSNNNSDCSSLPIYKNRNTSMIEPTDCPPDLAGREPFCRKTTYSISDNNDVWFGRVVRNCGYIKSKHECHNYNNDDHEEYVCQCFEDGCNSAHSTMATSAMFILPLLIAILFR